jgi:uncharacterized membrane protein
MSAVDVVLGVGVVSTGLFAGLLMTILVFFQRALKDLPASEFAVVMQRFLGVARAHPLHYGLVITSVLVPVVSLVMLRGSAGSPTFVLILIGLITFVVGPVLVSRYFAEPVYDVFLSWDTERPPDGWEEARDRYFRINAIRGLGSGMAFVCFVIAWRVRARWYGIALGLPMVFGLAAAVLHELLGAPTTDRLGEVSALGLIAFVLVERPAL